MSQSDQLTNGEDTQVREGLSPDNHKQGSVECEISGRDILNALNGEPAWIRYQTPEGMVREQITPETVKLMFDVDNRDGNGIYANDILVVDNDGDDVSGVSISDAARVKAIEIHCQTPDRTGDPATKDNPSTSVEHARDNLTQ